MGDYTHVESRARLVAESLFSLQDPWRDRFLVFVAQRALGQAWNGQLPTENELSAWLGSHGLRTTVVLMLKRWMANARVH